MYTSAGKSSERLPSMSNDIGTSVQVSKINLDRYPLDEIYARLHQIAYQSKPLGDIDEAN